MPLPERQLIRRLRSLAKSPQKGQMTLVTGIGDDTAILRPPSGHELLITTDFSLENVHFRRDWHPPESVGHRCLTRGLSDIAAMGGQPMAAFLSLALPSDVAQSWVDRFLSGLLKLAQRFQVPLAGGDTAQSPDGVLADIMVLGSVPRRRAILRSGARPGDRIYVTGRLGESAAEIRKRYAGGKSRKPPGRFLYPEPRLAVGQRLRGLASAMIDISDGISTDLAHICEESGVGAVIRPSQIPVAANAALEDALYGGDDYELLFTSAKRIPKGIAGISVTEVGLIAKEPGVWLDYERGRKKRLKSKGWEHFAADKS